LKVFLLAHQDDEVFLLPHIMNSEQKLFIYLTNGVSEGSSKRQLDRRTAEAKDVFQKYLTGFNAQAIWWGFENCVPEGMLHRFVSKENLANIERVIRSQGQEITLIITTTFEGAHQDHDAAAVTSRKLAKALRVNCVEMSTYPQWFSKFYSFKVLNPRFTEVRFDFARRKTLVLAVKLMASYKSQRNTWLGLGLGTVGAYAFRRYRSSKPARIAELHPCFYEFRGRALQGEVIQCLTTVK
jgi:hypothetical protein